jgi:hypothetical protein
VLLDIDSPSEEVLANSGISVGGLTVKSSGFATSIRVLLAKSVSASFNASNANQPFVALKMMSAYIGTASKVP